MTVSYSVECKDTDPGDVTVIKGQFQAVKILLIRRDTQTVLATVDSDQEGHLSTQVTIPASAQEGDAAIRVGHADDAFLTIG